MRWNARRGGSERDHHGRTRPLTLAAATAAGALLLAACSSSGSASPPVSSSSAAASPSQAVSAATLSSLRATIAKAEQVPQFTAPGPPVSAAAVKGKSALVMPINSEIDACNTQAHDFAALGAQLGMHVRIFADSGVPTQWVTGIQDATSAHDAALAMLCGIIPGAVAPQLQAATKAGVAIVDGNYNEVSNYTYLNGETAVNVIQGMTDDVDYALTQLNGKPLHALMVSSNSVVQGPASLSATASAIKASCPTACSVTNVVVPVQDWATSVQSDVASALVAHPDINAVFVAFDGMVQFALPAVQGAHRAGLAIYTWGGSRSVEKLMLAKGSLVAADPGPDEQWDAYEAMDQVIRLVGHHPAASVTKEVDPNRFWVPSNVSQFFGPGDSYGNKGFGGNAFINGFRKLWGLPPVSGS